jgi:hypothetical protein
MASFPTYIFNGNVSSQKGYYVNNILIAQTGGSNNVVDINPNGATGSGTANQLTFFHNSDKGTTTPYILIDNTSTSSTQTASVRFLSADGNTTYGSIVGNTTGLNFNNNGSIGYITMTLGTGSTSSTLNFVKPDNSLYGSIVGNTSGLNLTSTSNLNLTSTSNLNIAGSGASSTVQINNFKTLNITGVDATSSVQISNITSLNAPGLATLTTSSTQLYINSSNNIVKKLPVYLYINADASSNISTYTYNGSSQWEKLTDNKIDAQTTMILIKPTDPKVTYNWPTTTKWVFTTATPITNATANSPLPDTLKTGLIKFPTPGLYYISVIFTRNSTSGNSFADNTEFFIVKNFNRNTQYTYTVLETQSTNILSRTMCSSDRFMAYCTTYIDNNWDSATPDTISIIAFSSTATYIGEKFILTITKLY